MKTTMRAALITVPAFEGGGIRHFFGTRHQPADPFDQLAGVAGGRRRPARRPPIVVAVKQVHGTNALVVDRRIERGTVFPGGWDALLTDQPGVLLTIRTADCVPVLIHDPIRKVVAAAHAGWRGAVAGIIPKTVSLMREQFRSQPADLQMVIGPSAGPCCYEVDQPVLEPLRAQYPFWRSVARETGRARAMLDLRELIRRQSESCGLEGTRISTVRVCTICHPALFYSYRRDGTVKETMISGIMLDVGKDLARRRSQAAAHANSRRSPSSHSMH